MRLFLLFLLSLTIFTPARAEIAGPITRDLGGGYFLVQCNRTQLKPDNEVCIMRAGQQVGVGKVMRHQEGLCSIRLIQGEARRLDTVHLLGGSEGMADRGPELTHFGSITGQASKAAPSRQDAPKKRGYFDGLHTSGQVYQLNTNQFLTP